VDSLSSDEEEWSHDHNHNTSEIFPQVNFDDLDSSILSPLKTPANPVDDEKVQMFYRMQIFRLEAIFPSSLRLTSFHYTLWHVTSQTWTIPHRGDLEILKATSTETLVLRNVSKIKLFEIAITDLHDAICTNS
jgi:hypothetical protein